MASAATGKGTKVVVNSTAEAGTVPEWAWMVAS
jgi:hypothetical protein